MILIDANLLIYAATSCPEQTAARAWLDGEINGGGRVGLAWPSITAFLRITTSVRMYRSSAASMEKAWNQAQAWLDCSNVWVPLPTERHQTLLGTMLKAAPGGGDLVPDADLAALALEHGLTLCSTDGDFARFPGLKWINPLAPQ